MVVSKERFLKTTLTVSVAILLLSLGHRALWDPDEGRYAEMAREVLVLHDWLTPHLDYLLYFEKPMMYVWLVATSFNLFGVSEWSARLVSVIAGLGGTALIGLMAWRLWGRRSGLIAALCLITSIEYFVLSGVVDINMTLTFFITAAMVFFWLGITDQKSRYFLLSWAFMALATLTKGPIGIILPMGAICSYMLLSRHFNLIKESIPILGIILFLAIAFPWFYLVSIKNPGFFSFFFLNQNIQRYVTSHERYQPFYFFIPVIIGGALPWTFLLPAAVSEIREHTIPREILYILAWFFFIFLFFTPSHSKLATYVLPCFPPLALIMGYLFRDGSPVMTRRPLYAAGFLWLCIGIFLTLIPVLASQRIVDVSSTGMEPLTHVGVAAGSIIILGTILGVWIGSKYDAAIGFSIMGMAMMIMAFTYAPVLDNFRSTKFLVRDLPHHIQLYTFKRYFPSSSFYAQRQVTVVEYTGELDFGIKRSKHKGFVLTLDDLADIMKKDKNAYCLTSARYLPALRMKIPAIKIARQSNDFCLVKAPEG